MTRDELKAYILQHYEDMTVLEMSKEIEETVGRIYNVCYELGVRAKARKHRTDRAICNDRPGACYDCPYPECVCNESVTKGEAAYLFAGLGREENKTAKKLEPITERSRE